MIKTISFRYSNVRFLDKGKGRTIVLLHGFLESIEIWEEFVEELSKKFRVIAIDLCGHGESDCIGYIHSMELMAECVKSVMNHLRLRKFVLVGHSMGGYVSLAFAELFPDNIKGLVLFHSSALADSPEKKIDRDRAILLVKKEHKQFIKELITKLFAPGNVSLMREEIKKVKNIASKTSKQGIIAGLEGMKERKNRELIINFATYPILFIVGKKDLVIRWNAMLPQIELVKQGEVLMLENSGHMGFYEAKEEALIAIRKFARKVFYKKEK